MTQVEALLSALGRITKRRQALKAREHGLVGRERKLVDAIGRALSDLGYRFVPLDEGKATSRARVTGKPRVRQDLKCPKCERRFSFVMHVARHMSAMHATKNRGVKRAAA